MHPAASGQMVQHLDTPEFLMKELYGFWEDGLFSNQLPVHLKYSLNVSLNT